MIKNFILVAIGGAVGSMLRYGCSVGVGLIHWRPWVGTLMVNIVGSLLIGLLLGAQAKGQWQQTASVGFCGGFTTFSTFSLQSAEMLRNGEVGTAMGYMSASLTVCIMASWIGIVIGEKLTHA